MTYAEFIKTNISDTQIHLDGKTAYRIERNNLATVFRVKKSDFAKLFQNRDNAIVYLINGTVKKYTVAINKLGYAVKSVSAYDSDTTIMYVENI